MPTLGGAYNMSATGGAGGANARGANELLAHCDRPFGTMAVDEDQNARWWFTLTRRYPKLGSTIPVLRMMIQQSNCFVVVERGRSMNNWMRERALRASGELRTGSDFGKGQVVAADYTMSPSIHFSAEGTSGMGGGLASVGGALFGAVAGLVAGGLSSNEASTTLLLIDNRSGVQIAASTGSAKNFDFTLFGGLSAAAYWAVPVAILIPRRARY